MGGKSPRMSDVRSWIQRQAARLDGPRERRAVALTAALLFAVLTLGPRTLQAVDRLANPAELRLEAPAGRPSGPVRFRAFALNADVTEVRFTVTAAEGGRTVAARRIGNGAAWESEEFVGVPAQSYDVVAQAVLRGGGTLASRGASFTVGGYRTFEPAAEDPTRSAAFTSLVAWPGTVPSVEARGVTTGFISEEAAFQVRAVGGLAFQGEYAAERDVDNAWRGSYPLPGGATYEVTFIAKDGDGYRASAPREVRVPMAEPAPPVPDAVPAATPVVTLLFPAADASVAGAVPLAAKVDGATATALSFDVLDPAGVIRAVEAVTDGVGRWTATFTGSPGSYHVGARAMLEGGPTSRSDYRLFRIEAASGTAALPAGLAAELVSPSEASAPAAGPVAISGRVLGGVPDSVTAVVTGPSGEATIAATKTAGDFWNALFEGPPGAYRVRLRALVGGKEVFSPERRFTVLPDDAEANP